MPFWGFCGVHPDHNLWQFDYLHQGSQIFHFRCDLKTVLFNWKNSWLYPYLAYFDQIAWLKGLLRSYLTSKMSPEGTSCTTWFCKSSFLSLGESGGVIWEKYWKLGPKFRSRSSFGLQAHLFCQLWSLKPPYNDLPNHLAQLIPLGELLDVEEALIRPFGPIIWAKLVKNG